MKIALIAPGSIDIPPPGWGALETVLWNQYINLKNIGYEVLIINHSDPNHTYRKVAEFNPDIVHLHYGKHYEILPHINCRKIITNHDGSFVYSKAFHENIIRNFMYDCEFFILTSWEKELLGQIGIPPQDIKILPNGVDFHKFNRLSKPKYPNKSICLGKIDNRKRQAYLQQLCAEVVFVGQNHDPEFKPLDSNYLGSWTREQVFNNLTEYTNLILLSQSELQPLVCLEALAAGLGLVISESCRQNLDTSLPFISVVPNTKIEDQAFIKDLIISNREICNSLDRSKITEYAHSFDWSKIIQKYHQYIQ